MEIRPAGRAGADREAILGAPVGARLAARFADRPRPAQAFPQPSARERAVLALLTERLTTPGDRRRLGRSQKTVRDRVSNVLTESQVPTRADAITTARRAGPRPRSPGAVRRPRRGRGVARRPLAVVDLGPCLPRSLRDHVSGYVRASVVSLRGETSAAGSPVAR